MHFSLLVSLTRPAEVLTKADKSCLKFNYKEKTHVE
jgi:hypothetical protein